MTTDDFVRDELRLALNCEDPRTEASFWNGTHRAGPAGELFPMWLLAAQYCTTRRFVAQALADGYGKSGEEVIKFRDTCTARAKADPVTWVARGSRIVIFFWWRERDAVHPIKAGFERAPCYNPQDPPPAQFAPDYYRQVTPEEIQQAIDVSIEAGHRPPSKPSANPPHVTFEERLKIQCSQHGGSLIECGCKTLAELIGEDLPDFRAMATRAVYDAPPASSEPGVPAWLEQRQAEKKAAAAAEIVHDEPEPEQVDEPVPDADATEPPPPAGNEYPIEEALAAGDLTKPVSLACMKCAVVEHGAFTTLMAQARGFGCGYCGKAKSADVEVYDASDRQAWPSSNYAKVETAARDALNAFKKLKVAELRKLVKSRGNDYKGLKKGDLVKLLTEGDIAASKAVAPAGDAALDEPEPEPVQRTPGTADPVLPW